jgi:hypothetical protein
VRELQEIADLGGARQRIVVAQLDHLPGEAALE